MFRVVTKPFTNPSIAFICVSSSIIWGTVFPSALINDSEARFDGSYPKKSTNFAPNSGRYPRKVLALTPNCCAASSHE
jgi:hypothetical protein